MGVRAVAHSCRMISLLPLRSLNGLTNCRPAIFVVNHTEVASALFRIVLLLFSAFLRLGPAVSCWFMLSSDVAPCFPHMLSEISRGNCHQEEKVGKVPTGVFPTEAVPLHFFQGLRTNIAPWDLSSKRRRQSLLFASFPAALYWFLSLILYYGSKPYENH